MNLRNISTKALENALVNLTIILADDFHAHAYNKPEIEVEGKRMRLMTAEIEIELLRRSLPWDSITQVRAGNISVKAPIES